MRLGSGGMGEVLLAGMTRAGHREVVALKRIHRELLHDKNAVSAFLREQRICGLLTHPNIVALKAAGEDEEGPWLALEFIHGRPASDLINSLNGLGRPVPLDVALLIARDVCAALAYAHELPLPDSEERGVLHRDISPDNVLLGYDGSVKLADFGIAQQMGATRITQTGRVRGKFGYLSPELHEGKPASKASDLFALAATLYLLFTGADPFPGDTDALVLNAVFECNPTPVQTLRPDLPPELAELLMEALRKDPRRRPHDVRELIIVLERALGADEGLARDGLRQLMTAQFPETDPRRRELTQAISAQGTATVVRTPDKRRSRATTVLLSAATLAVVGAGGYAAARMGAEPPPPPAPDPSPIVVAPADAGIVEVAAAPEDGGTIGLTVGEPIVQERVQRAKRSVLWIRVTPWADVFVDGEARGRTPIERFAISPGRHTVLLVNKERGVSKSLPVTVKRGELKELTITLQ